MNVVRLTLTKARGPSCWVSLFLFIYARPAFKSSKLQSGTKLNFLILICDYVRKKSHVLKLSELFLPTIFIVAFNFNVLLVLTWSHDGFPKGTTVAQNFLLKYSQNRLETFHSALLQEISSWKYDEHVCVLWL